MSYRLGGTDGVSIEAAKWGRAFASLGAEVTTVAGSGAAEHLISGLASDSSAPVDAAALDGALRDVDLVIVENCCSLPLNPRAGAVLVELLTGRPAILRHHDLPWQRPQFRDFAGRAHDSSPPDDASWWHVTINERSRLELRARGITAETFYNCFDPEPLGGDRERTRTELGVADGEILALQPTRAIPRKNVAGGVLFSRAIGATYWLFGPAEDGYDTQLRRILDRAGTRVIEGRPAGGGVEDAYAACDIVVLPSTFEGFGNPSIESAMHRKPLAIGRYPVAGELRRFGFSWFDVHEPAPAARWLADPDIAVLDRNEFVARLRFSTTTLPERLKQMVTSQ